MNKFIVRSKTGLFIGMTVGILLVLWFLLTPSRGPLLPDYSAASIIFFIVSMCLPVMLSGAVSGAIIEGIFIKQYIFSKHLLSPYRKGSVIGCIIGGLIFFPLGAFLGVVLSSFFGGGLGSAIGDKIGISIITIPVGIGLGIIIVVCVITLIGAALGTIIGLIIHVVIRTWHNDITRRG